LTIGFGLYTTSTVVVEVERRWHPLHSCRRGCHQCHWSTWH